ncbi:hypothetical protein AB0F13_21160 [Streptomyces sp. NPDC026206]|uniref:hypothetical protein n=1 Tax=Streptomyces sp. NPDC026206 TaxID=3157089 RepID=UPI003403E4E8
MPASPSAVHSRPANSGMTGQVSWARVRAAAASAASAAPVRPPSRVRLCAAAKSWAQRTGSHSSRVARRGEKSSAE